MAKELKDKIKNAYENETPDFREVIISKCKNETQVEPVSATQTRSIKPSKNRMVFRRLVAVMSCVFLFGAGLFVGKILPETLPVASAQTHVYIDVNPSIELALDQDNIVLSCTATNQDAETVLNNMNLKGVELKTALNAIVGSMYVNGYLTEEDNSMLISVDSKNQSNSTEFLTYITNQVNDVLKNSQVECSIIAQKINVNEDLRSRAKEHGVSVGKMKLLDKMIDGVEHLTIDDLANLSGMSIKDLNLIYSQKPNNQHRPNDEVVSGSTTAKVTKEQALNAVLNEIGVTANDVLLYNIITAPSKHGKYKVVYYVTVLLEDYVPHNYEVDCQTGEVVNLSTPPNVH